MTPERYPVPQPHYDMHLTAQGSHLFYVRRDRTLARSNMGLAGYMQWEIPELTARYLMRCDGATSEQGLVDWLTRATGYHPLVAQTLAGQIQGLLLETGAIRLAERPADIAKPMRVTGGFDSFAPLHMAFEITDTCNFRCEHCYVSASPEKHNRKDGAEIIENLRQLAKAGVRIVELTGGECTTHPQFREILSYASETFLMVAIISNGFLLGKRPDLTAFVADHVNVAVQISIDGTREFHDNFRKMPGSWDAAWVAVKALRKADIFVRVAMSVSRESVDQLIDVFHAAKEADASTFAVAPVSSFGRGINIAGCAAEEHELIHRINDILKPVRDDPMFFAIRKERENAQANKEINCGAGWRSFALNNDGSVRSCLFLADSKKFGNIDRQDYDGIFRQPAMHMFKNAPSPGGAECSGPQPDGTVGCKYFTTCMGCFAKAFRVSETEYPQCPWRARYFPGMQLSFDEPLVPITLRRPARAAGGAA